MKLVQDRTPCENYKANLEELTEKVILSFMDA